MSNISNSVKLSNVLENSLFMDIEKMCLKCKEMLREEEILTGFQKDLNNYTVKCPKCQQCFVPKFTIYSEQDNVFLGQTRMYHIKNTSVCNKPRKYAILDSNTCLI